MIETHIITGEVKVAKTHTILRANAIGSCVVIAVYDSQRKVGGMAHVMMPGDAPEKEPVQSKYSSNAIFELLEKMIAAGAARNNIEACLIGGGNVLKRQDDTICNQNIQSVTEILESENIPIESSSVGGVLRRTALLNTDTGEVHFTEGDSGIQLLWNFTQSEGLVGVSV